MINLIPPQAKKTLLKEYWIRVVSVWLMVLSITLFVGAGVLSPVYFLINSQISIYKESAVSASEKVVSYENVSTDLVDASQQAKIVMDEKDLPVFSDYTSLFFGLEGEKVKINKISINRDEVQIQPISIAGFAENRQSLASFRDVILAQEGVQDVDLPISNLAQDLDIPFTITVTLNDDEI
jgi:hypothetical protein